MNPSDGTYLVNECERDHAIRKRLNFVYTVADIQTWYEYTRKSAWHPDVPSFVLANSPLFYDTGARDAGKCFPCPSNWEKVSNILLTAEKLKKSITSDRAVESMIAGQIGDVACNKFLEFVRDRSTAITPEEILTQYAVKKKNTRTKVLKMLGQKLLKKKDKNGQFIKENIEGANIRHDIISEVSKGLAIILFSEMPKISQDLAKNFSYFLWDLPPELLQAFAAEHLLTASEEKGQEGEKYLADLSDACQANKVYQLKMREIVTAVKRYKEAKGLTSENDATF